MTARKFIRFRTRSCPPSAAGRWALFSSNSTFCRQQRVAIARALIAQPEVIFADEPTGNLDSKSGGEVMELLRGIQKQMGKTLVIITHDNRIAAAADRQLTIMDGVLSEVAAE